MEITRTISIACPNGANMEQIAEECFLAFNEIPAVVARGRFVHRDRVFFSEPGAVDDLTIETSFDLSVAQIATLDAILLASGPETVEPEGRFVVKLAALSKPRLRNLDVGTFRFVKNVDGGTGALVYRALDGWRRVANEGLLVPIP